MTVPSMKWPVKSLGDVAAKVPYAIVDGPFGSNMKSSDYVASGVPVLQGKNITNDSFRWIDIRYLSNEKAIELKRSSVRVDDILLVKIGSIGYSAVIDSLAGHEYAIIPANLAKITPDKTVIDTRYLFRLLTSPDSKRYFQSNASKTAQPALSLGKIKALPVPLPPLTEQRRIAAVLDQADALRVKRREALAQLDSLTQSIFIEMFGDPIDNPMDWPTKKLSEIVRVRRGGSPRPIEQYLGGTVNWIKIGDATRGDDIYLSHCKEKITEDGLKKTVFLKQGSLIFANCGVSLGFARILKIDGCIHDGWLSFDEFDEGVLNKIFFLKALNSATERFRAMAPAGTQPNLNTAIMKNFSMILPPIAIQRRFTEQLGKTQALKAMHEASVAELDSLFSSLQHRAFRGDL